MKKAVSSMVVIGLLISGSACGKSGGKYAEVIGVMEKMAAAVDTLAASVKNARSAGEVAAAFETAAREYREMEPAVRSVREKFPEIKAMDENPAAELQPTFNKILAAGGKLMGVMEVIGLYVSDPKVKEALKAHHDARDRLVGGPFPSAVIR